MMKLPMKYIVITGMLATALCSDEIYAHGGEDHGEASLSDGGGAASGAPLVVSKETQFLMGIRTEPAQRRMLTTKIKAVGRLIARAGGRADVAPVASGRVVVDPDHPIVRLGDRVAAGDTLAVLEQLPLDQFALDAAYHTAKSELEQARQEYARHQELRQIASLKELQQAETRLKVAEAEFTRLSNEMRLYRDVWIEDRTVHRFYLRSPIAGTVTEANVVVGERVDADRWLFRIVSLDPLWVEAAVYETDLPRVEAARRAIVTTKAYPGEQFSGRLIGISGALDEASRTAKAIFEVSNPGGRLKVGMFAEAAIDTGEPVEGTAVPLAAVLDANGKSLVYIHTRPEEFIAREVVLGQRDGDFVEVRTGVAPGERAVTVGAYQLWSQGLR